MMKQDIENQINVMFSCQKSGKMHSFSLSRPTLYFGVGFLCVLFVILCSGALFFSYKGFKLVQYHGLKRDVLQLQTQYIDLQDKMDLMESEIEDVSLKQSKYSRSFFGRHRKNKMDLRLKKYQKKKTKKQITLAKTFLNKPKNQDSVEIELLKENAYALSQSQAVMQQLLDYVIVEVDLFSENVQRLKENFVYLPSIWPTYGYIRSKYGFRTHPITRKWVFHKGIDIPSWIGAPVRVSADGVVEASGDYGSYGKLVVVRHKNHKTFYAHLFKSMVHAGQFVKKGEVIAQVGNSGLSTGPHLHYEIRENYKNKSILPNRYLELLFAL